MAEDPRLAPARSDEDRESRLRRARDSAVALPVAGLVLLLSPFSHVFAVDGRLFGVPVVVAYVFGAWLALILAARAVSARMLENAAEDGELAQSLRRRPAQTPIPPRPPTR
ncbi:MAG: hypothetical protein AAF698_07945 [Pseudomonadota bacterium]